LTATLLASCAAGQLRYRSGNELEGQLKRLIWAGLAACIVVVGVASAQTASGLNLSINCPSGRPGSIVVTAPPAIYAEVMGFVSKPQAQQLMSNKEASTGEVIDPAYTNDQRVVVQWRAASGAYLRSYAIVPIGTTVHVGEEISFVPSHADPDNLCQYIPNLIHP